MAADPRYTSWPALRSLDISFNPLDSLDPGNMTLYQLQGVYANTLPAAWANLHLHELRVGWCLRFWRAALSVPSPSLWPAWLAAALSYQLLQPTHSHSLRMHCAHQHLPNLVGLADAYPPGALSRPG